MIKSKREQLQELYTADEERIREAINRMDDQKFSLENTVKTLQQKVFVAKILYLKNRLFTKVCIFCPGELCPGELCPGEQCPGELCPGELYPGELCPGEL